MGEAERDQLAPGYTSTVTWWLRLMVSLSFEEDDVPQQSLMVRSEAWPCLHSGGLRDSNEPSLGEPSRLPGRADG